MKKTETRVCLRRLLQTRITSSTTAGGGRRCQTTVTLRPCIITNIARAASKQIGLLRRVGTVLATRRRHRPCLQVSTRPRRLVSLLRHPDPTVSRRRTRAVRWRPTTLAHPPTLPTVAARRQETACRHLVPKVLLLARTERARAAS
jgi:hypothetical protein